MVMLLVENMYRLFCTHGDLEWFEVFSDTLCIFLI